MEEQSPTDKLQNNVDKMKALSLANNIHNLMPPTNRDENRVGEVAIVSALRAKPLIAETFVQLKGYMLDPLQGIYVPYRRPIMNNLGIGNFMQTCQSIAETYEYANFKEEDIPKYAVHLYVTNYPYYTIYFEDYELAREDFNLIGTILWNFIITALHKAKGGGHRNVVRGTYSEDLLGRMAMPDRQQKQGGGGFLDALNKLNPLKRR